MGIISSNPLVATMIHGLTEVGKKQADVSSARFAKDFNGTGMGGTNKIKIVTSDFTRARMTAEIFAAKLGVTVVEDVRLRERFFGTLDGGKDDRYGDVWELDKDDADHTEFQVESVNSVRARTVALVQELDTGDSTVMLVAHGDVLQIMQTAFEGVRGEEHRSLKHMETAECRLLNK